MRYVIVDFEWNQPLPEQPGLRGPVPLEAEIIEIGAIRLDEHFAFEAEYRAFVKPVFYPFLNGKVVRLTKIRPRDLDTARGFPAVCRDFLDWCGEDCCLCTWGSDDIPALLDNMLAHGMDTPELLRSCDLQQIYSREIMRDEKRWALEKAVDLLGLPKERAHDALNDVRNTLTLCRRVDLVSYLDEYGFSYVNYGRDRLAGLVEGRLYRDLEEAGEDRELMSLLCPWCGRRLPLERPLWQKRGTLLSYCRCPEGDEYLAFFRLRRGPAGELRLSRQVYGMSDVLWDLWQDALDREEERQRDAGRCPEGESLP